MKISIMGDERDLMETLTDLWEGHLNDAQIEGLDFNLKKLDVFDKDVDVLLASAMEKNRLKAEGYDRLYDENNTRIFKEMVKNITEDISVNYGEDLVIPDVLKETVEPVSDEYWDYINSAVDMEEDEVPFPDEYLTGTAMEMEEPMEEKDMTPMDVIPEEVNDTNNIPNENEKKEQAAKKLETPEEFQNAVNDCLNGIDREEEIRDYLIKKKVDEKQIDDLFVQVKNNKPLEATQASLNISADINDRDADELLENIVKKTEIAKERGASEDYCEETKKQAEELHKNVKTVTEFQREEAKDLENEKAVPARIGILQKLSGTLRDAMEWLKQSLHDEIKCRNIGKATDTMARKENQARRYRVTQANTYARLNKYKERLEAKLEKSENKDKLRIGEMQKKDQNRLRMKNVIHALKGEDMEKAAERSDYNGRRTNKLLSRIDRIEKEMSLVKAEYDRSLGDSMARARNIEIARAENNMRESYLVKAVYSFKDMDINSKEARNERNEMLEDIARKIKKSEKRAAKNPDKTVYIEEKKPEEVTPAIEAKPEPKVEEVKPEPKADVEPKREEADMISIKISEKLTTSFQSKGGEDFVRVKVPNADRDDNSKWGSFVVKADHVVKNDDGRVTVNLPAGKNVKVTKFNENTRENDVSYLSTEEIAGRYGANKTKSFESAAKDAINKASENQDKSQPKKESMLDR